ncbi:MAG TPA: hypothetical protein VIG24_03955 [Acidimicrobiia bacterium]
MNEVEVERLRVTADMYMDHRRNHSIAAPDLECPFCDDRLNDVERMEEGVMYLATGVCP